MQSDRDLSRQVRLGLSVSIIVIRYGTIRSQIWSGRKGIHMFSSYPYQRRTIVIMRASYTPTYEYSTAHMTHIMSNKSAKSASISAPIRIYRRGLALISTLTSRGPIVTNDASNGQKKCFLEMNAMVQKTERLRMVDR